MNQDAPQVSFLSDFPDHIPALVEGLIAEWKEHDTNERRLERTLKLEAHLHRSSLPLALVAHREGAPLGLVCLRETELDGQDKLGPWLGGLFVYPEARKCGIGTCLCSAAERVAFSLGYSELYLFTLDQQHFYRRLGWQQHQSTSWHGRSGDILHRHLGQAGPDQNMTFL